MSSTVDLEGGLAGQRVVVLGATGFLGRWVARELGARGATAWLVARDARAAQRIGSEYGWAGTIVELDLVDPTTLASLLREVRPAVVFNLAGYGIDRTETDVRLAEAINRDLVASLLELVPRHRDPAWPGPSLVHTGSALEYGAVGGDLNEDTHPNPTTTYGQTKLAATLDIERAVAAGRCQALTARLFTVYGPGEHEGRLMPTVLAARSAARPIPMTDGRQRRDFTFVADVVAGLVRATVAAGPAPATFNLATGTLLTVRRFVEIATATLGIPSTRFEFGKLPHRPDEMAHEAVAIERLRSFLHWVPDTTVESGAKATAAWVDRALPGRPPKVEGA